MDIVEQLKEDYEAGATMEALAERCGATVSSMRRLLIKAGAKIRHQGRKSLADKLREKSRN